MSPAPKRPKDDDVPEEKPKRTRKKADAPEAEAEAGPKRTRKNAADDAPATPEATGAEAATEATGDDAAEAKPKRTRKTPDDAPTAEAAPKPARKPRAKATADEPAEDAAATETLAAAEAATEAPAAEAPATKPAPKRRGRGAAADEPAARPAPRRRGGRAPEPAVVVRAQARYVRTSARKARLVCDHIRGKDVAEARAILAFTPRAVAEAWSKLLESAVANAEHNHELVGEELRIHAVHADEGPTLKRFRPRAMGRATRIRKRTSHLSIVLTPKES